MPGSGGYAGCWYARMRANDFATALKSADVILSLDWGDLAGTRSGTT